MFIKYHRNVYKKNIIQEATKVFCDLANFKITEDRSYFKIILSKINKEALKNIKEEFSNYLIFLTKNKS